MNINCNKKRSYKLYEMVNKKKGDVEVCLSINNKLDTCYSLYLGADRNFRKIRLKYIETPENLCDFDRVSHPVDRNMVHKTGKLDTTIYNGILRRLYTHGINLSETEQKNLLLKSNILLNDGDSKYKIFFYPDEKKAIMKLDSIYRFHFFRSKEISENYKDDSWWPCEDIIVFRTIGYMLINPDNMKFIIFSRQKVINHMFIAYKKDSKGFLTRLELLNPSTVLMPIFNN